MTDNDKWELYISAEGMEFLEQPAWQIVKNKQKVFERVGNLAKIISQITTEDDWATETLTEEVKETARSKWYWYMEEAWRATRGIKRLQQAERLAITQPTEE